MWPSVKTWLNLGDYFPKDIRKKIYGYLGGIELELVKVAHGKPFGSNGYMYGLAFGAAVARKGYLELLKWMLSGNKANMGAVMAHAAHANNLEILRWGQSKGLDLDDRIYFRNYNPEVVEWIYQNGYVFADVFLFLNYPQGRKEVAFVNMLEIPPEVKDSVLRALRKSSYVGLSKQRVDRVIEIQMEKRALKLRKQREKYATSKAK